jgi:hypothetical protein
MPLRPRRENDQILTGILLVFAKGKETGMEMVVVAEKKGAREKGKATVLKDRTLPAQGARKLIEGIYNQVKTLRPKGQ